MTKLIIHREGSGRQVQDELNRQNILKTDLSFYRACAFNNCVYIVGNSKTFVVTYNSLGCAYVLNTQFNPYRVLEKWLFVRSISVQSVQSQ